MNGDRDLLWRGVPKRAIGGLIVGLIPFVVSCHQTSTVTDGGRMVGCSHIDFSGLVGGGIAVAVGVSILAMQPVPLLHRIGYLVLLAGIGAVQIARGLGYIGGPCN